MFPPPVPVRRVLCGHCRTRWVRVDRLVAGRYGETCAAELGLIRAPLRLRVREQSGPTLFDPADEEELCDGWDR